MASSLTWTLPATWPRETVRRAVQRPQSGRPVMTPADPPPGELSEAAIVAACLDGNAGAFEVIVERHRRSVYQLCYRFVGNHEDASDLTQDVFLRAYRGLRSFRGQSTLATWLYRIGVNVCLNRVSAKKPLSESIEERQFVDEAAESAPDLLLKDERGRSEEHTS